MLPPHLWIFEDTKAKIDKLAHRDFKEEMIASILAIQKMLNTAIVRSHNICISEKLKIIHYFKEKLEVAINQLTNHDLPIGPKW